MNRRERTKRQFHYYRVIVEQKEKRDKLRKQVRLHDWREQKVCTQWVISKRLSSGAQVQFNLAQYHSFADVINYLNSLAITYPELVSVQPIGTTHEGRQIPLIKVHLASNFTGINDSPDYKQAKRRREARNLGGRRHPCPRMGFTLHGSLLHPSTGDPVRQRCANKTVRRPVGVVHCPVAQPRWIRIQSQQQ